MTSHCFDVLLVEDNPGDVYLFRKALTDAGLNYALTVIDDGALAVAFIRGEAEHAGRTIPDLAIIDLSLPKHNGIEIVEAVRAETLFTDMPIVIASSSPKPLNAVDLERWGRTRYISKPIDLESFLQIGLMLKEILLQGQARAQSLERDAS